MLNFFFLCDVFVIISTLCPSRYSNPVDITDVGTVACGLYVFVIPLTRYIASPLRAYEHLRSFQSIVEIA